MATVLIRIDGVDRTSYIVFRESGFDSAVNGATGTAKLLVRDDDRTLTIATGASLELLVDGDPVWTGFVTEVTRTFVFPALNVDDAGLTRFFRVLGVDLNILFQKRIVATIGDEADVFGKLYPPDTPDNEVIADLVADYLDLSGDDLDVSTFVEFVGNINEDQDARAWSGGYTWAQAMASIASLPGAVYFLAPTRDLVYTDANTEDAPFPLSDLATPGAAGYREMSIALDGTGLANDVLAWGMGYGTNEPVFVRDDDAASLAQHGRWQAGVVKSGIYKQATINRVASSIVDGSPENLRGAKDDKVGVTVVTYVPGFLPAQKVDFTSAVFDFNDVIPIRRMRVTFDSPDTPRYELNLSHAIDEPWGFFDQFMLTWPKFVLPPLPPLPPIPASIIDDFDRLTSNEFGTPSRGAPDWVTDLAFQITGNGISADALVDGVGRSLLLISGTRVPTSSIANLVSSKFTLSIPEIVDPNEFAISVGLVLAAPNPTGDSQSATSGRLTIRDIGSPALLCDVVLGLARSGGTSSVTVRDNMSGIHTDSEALGVTSFDSTITIDRSVSRGTTIFTIGVLTTLTVPNGVTAADGLEFEFIHTSSFRPFATPISDFTVEASLENLRLVESSGVVLAGDPWGYGCEILRAHTSSTDYLTTYPYVPGSIYVFRSGMLQRPGTDYTADGPSRSIVFSDAVGPTEPLLACYQTGSVT